MSYSGKITTTGKSEAIRLEKSLFRSHPEFKQKAKVRAEVIGPGTMLISLDGPAAGPKKEDPVIGAFLSFLERDMREGPARLAPLSRARLAQVRKLVAGTRSSDDDVLPADVTL
jgi:antitoxin PrlF